MCKVFASTRGVRVVGDCMVSERTRDTDTVDVFRNNTLPFDDLVELGPSTV